MQRDSRGNKRKKILIVPGICKFIYQPNRVTNAVYSYSLIQERLLNALIFYLQEAIKERMDGHDYTKMVLFQEFQNDQIYRFKIPLKEISTPQNYAHVKESLKKLASLVVEIPYLDEHTKKQMMRYTGLIRVNVPKNNERTSHIEVEIEKRVARLLIEIDMNKEGQPINYTRFEYQIAQNASSKYTSRIYKLLCSWRSKGGFIMRIDDFRQWLGIEAKYKYYNDIKKYILIPVQEELFEKADCWFNCNDPTFAIKDGNSVTRLNFKVITPEFFEQEGKKIDYIRYMLKNYYYFTDKNVEALKSILCGSNSQKIITKLLSLNEYISDKNNNITNIPSYVIKAIRNEFEHCTD